MAGEHRDSPEAHGGEADLGTVPENSVLADGQSATASQPGEPPARDVIREEVDRVARRVREPGRGRRWFDPPYRVLDWLSKHLPRPLKAFGVSRVLTGLMNYLLAFHQHHWNKEESRDGWLHNMLLPDGEAVRQGGVWVVDFFPPSRFNTLRTALRKTGWDRCNPFIEADGSNSEQVERARGGRGARWWQLGTVVSPDSGYLVFDATRERLPPEFSLIEVTAIQVGSSLTAVIGFFRMSKSGQAAVDDVWRAEHEPRLQLRALRRPRTWDRRTSAIRVTQDERQRIHDAARDWLADRCPGVFSQVEDRQPVIDFMVFDRFDPELEELPREELSSLDALGLDLPDLYRMTSPQFPGCVLVPSRSGGRGNGVSNSWCVTGRHERVNELNGGSADSSELREPDRLAHEVSDAARIFLLYLGVEQYLTNLERTYSRARDLAQVEHGRHRASKLLSLRQELLTTSLDLRAVALEVDFLWSRWWRRWMRVDVVRSRSRATEDPSPSREFNVVKEFNRARKRRFSRLLAEEAAYREVLVTVASLGSSIESGRLGRRALGVAAVSLIVAIVTLLATMTTGTSFWSDVVGRVLAR